MNDWKTELKPAIVSALKSIRVVEIELLERVSCCLTLRLVVEEMTALTHRNKARIIDSLLAKNAPTLYSDYVFYYQVWDSRSWSRRRNHIQVVPTIT